MADRFPLIIDSVDQQIQELSSGDNLDLASSGVVNANLVHSSGVNVGVVTATKFKGDGSELDNLPASGGTFEATASGTLADGSKVIVNADGTVSVVAQTETTGPGTGSATLFANHNTDHISGVFDSNSNRVVLFYRINDANPGKGAALVGEISGGSVTFGSPVDIDTVECTQIDAAFDSTNNKVVVGYRRYASDGTKYHHAKVGTVDPSNNSITFGAAEPINTNGESAYFDMIFDSSSGKIIVAYSDESNNFNGTVKVGTVTVGASPSNDTISFGSANVYYSAGQSATRCLAADTSNNRIVLVSHVDNPNQLIVRVGQISGTSITFGSSLQIYVGYSSSVAAAFDPSTNKVVVFYQASNSDPNPYRQYGLVGTVNASNNTIAFGSVQTVVSKGGTTPNKVVYDSDAQKLLVVYQNSDNNNLEEYFYVTVNSSNDTLSYSSSTVIGTTNNGYEGVIYDSNANQSLIYYQDYSNSRYGTYQLVGLTGFPVPSVGTPDIFNSSNFGSYYNSAVYDSTNNKVVIAYSDGGNSYYGTAIVGEVSGTGITFGTPTVFESGNSQYISAVHDSSNNKIVIAYRNYDSSSVGKAIVGEIFGNSISFPSSPGTYESDNTAYNSAVYDSANGKVVVAYTDFGDNGYGKARVGEVSGTSISFPSSSTTFKTASQSSPIRYIGITYDSTNNKVVIVYRNDSWYNYGEAIVGEVSGTGISFPSSSVPFNQGDSRFISPVHDSTNGKIVISYTDGMNDYSGTAIVGEVSGTSISFPSPSTVFNAAHTWYIRAVYDSTNQKVVTAYQNSGNSNYGTAIPGTVSGTGINFDSPVVFETAESQHISATYNSTNNKVVFAYLDFGNSYRGTAVTFDNRTISRNLTAENFIGISDGAYSDGETATIQISGAVDDAQSGLTPGQQYYVQNDGTLSETADSPSVLAGTAVAATKLIIG